MNQLPSKEFEIVEWTEAIKPLIEDERNKKSVTVYKGYNITTLQNNVTVSTVDYCVTVPITSREATYTLDKFTNAFLKPIANFINSHEKYLEEK